MRVTIDIDERFARVLSITAMRMCGAKMGRGKRLHQIGMQMRSGTRIIVKNADGKEKRRKHDRT